jgi:hypothetical protein
MEPELPSQVFPILFDDMKGGYLSTILGKVSNVRTSCFGLVLMLFAAGSSLVYILSISKLSITI